MRKSFFAIVSAEDSKVGSLPKASTSSSFDASGEAGLPSWVRKHEPRASKKAKPELESRQKKKVEETNCALAPASQTIKLLTVAEAAWRLNLSEKAIRRMIEAGNLAVVRIGRSIRIHPEVIEKIMRKDE
jgi:excisionase family DNA binding protein